MSTLASISPASASAQFSYPAAAAAPSYFPVPFHLQNAQYAAWPAAAPAAAPAVAPVPTYNAVYPMPQVQQAQHLFQKDSKIITPEALATVKAAIANKEKDKKVEPTKKAVPRKAAGQSWEDPTLADWPETLIVHYHQDNKPSEKCHPHRQDLMVYLLCFDLRQTLLFPFSKGARGCDV